jgi:hypothetical protein
VDLRHHVSELRAVPPLSEISTDQRAELDALLADAAVVEDLPGKWQAAVLEAELRAAGGKPAHGGGCCH